MSGILILNYVHSNKKEQLTYFYGQKLEIVRDHVKKSNDADTGIGKDHFYICTKQGKIISPHNYIEDCFKTRCESYNEVYIVPYRKWLEFETNIINKDNDSTIDKESRDENEVDTSPSLDEINEQIAELSDSVNKINKSLEKALKKKDSYIDLAHMVIYAFVIIVLFK